MARGDAWREADGHAGVIPDLPERLRYGGRRGRSEVSTTGLPPDPADRCLTTWYAIRQTAWLPAGLAILLAVGLAAWLTSALAFPGSAH
ncbi:MAG: hypothetical protein A3H33_07075 [Betaproteobacteria bacterium RIFCSPLOWO2_02_FULL_65_20]|nr:MAG: hypothetical protein A3H33_07075 [Betaproteobacteria bacterium RIFCSPLOWO2_02_FULL_65_20]